MYVTINNITIIKYVGTRILYIMYMITNFIASYVRNHPSGYYQSI